MDSSEGKKEQERREQGENFSKWFRTVTSHPLTGEPARAKDIAKATKISYGRVNVLLNHNCVDDGRVSLPGPETIDTIAYVYKANADIGKAIVGKLSPDTAKNILQIEPGSQVYPLSTKHILIAPPGEKYGKIRAALVEGYLLGSNDTVEAIAAQIRTEDKGDSEQ